MSTKEKFLKGFLFSFFIFFISFILLFFIKDLISYPKGADIFGYLFRTNVLYDSIKNGEFFPIYTKYWYNGTELFRSWPPFAYYIHAFLTFLTKGDVLNSYYLFLVLCFIISSFGWLLFGLRENRVMLCFIISIFYFFMPDNLRVMLSEGNIARVLLMAIFPYFFFFIMEFISYKKKYCLVFISLIVIITTFTHLMIAAMLGVALFLMLLIYSIYNKNYLDSIICLGHTALSYLLASIILIPGLFGGMLGLSSSVDAELGMWTEDIAISINPLYRITTKVDIFYFSTIFIIFLVLGIICYRKKSFPFLLTAFIIYLLTSSELIPLFKLLPLSQIFWMKRMIPIAYVIAFLGIIYWKKLRISTLCVFFILLFIDIIPSLLMFDNNFSFKFDKFDNSYTIQEYINNEAEEILLDKAARIVDNRIMIVDESLFGAIPSYYLSTNGLDCNFVSGWGLQGATIRSNIVNITEAFQNGYYEYTFDRLIEVGADVIILSKNFIETNQFENLDAIANNLGYYLVDQNENALLYKLKGINGTFGTITNYEYLAIGESSYYIEYIYPTFLQGDRIYLDEYSFEELSKYKKIYLSGFKYHDKQKAENLIRKLANSNIEVFIDMTKIPKNNLQGKDDFLGVINQEIYFTDKFPVLKVDDYQFKLDFKSNLYSNWLAIYLTNVDKVKASTFYLTYPNLVYWGTDETENINFLGFNLIYFCVENRNEDLFLLFDKIFNISEGQTPFREIKNIDVTYNIKENKIIIDSEYDNINTTISNCACFKDSDNNLELRNMLVVNKGQTIIDIKYPMFKEGIIITLFGFFIIPIYWILVTIVLKILKRGEKVEEEK